eukprot:Gb_33765 [translate_table: standard]
MCPFPSIWYSSSNNISTATTLHEVCSMDSYLPPFDHKPMLPVPANWQVQAGSDVTLDSDWQLQVDQSLDPNQCPTMDFADDMLMNSYLVAKDVSMKKLCHNANERHRRKKLNSLYSKMQSLLPDPNRKRKLSIPSTVCRVLKYIPELRNQIEQLTKQRDELVAIKRISEDSLLTSAESSAADNPKFSIPSDCLQSHEFPTVTVHSMLGLELLITIYTYKAGLLFSTLLLLLEEEGLNVMNASTFVSEGNVCYNLHLQMMMGANELDIGTLRKKLLLLCEKSMSLYGV